MAVRKKINCVCVVFTVQGGCIHGSPSICIGNAFFVLGEKGEGSGNKINGPNVKLKYQKKSQHAYVNERLSIIISAGDQSQRQEPKARQVCTSLRGCFSPDGDL